MSDNEQTHKNDVVHVEVEEDLEELPPENGNLHRLAAWEIVKTGEELDSYIDDIADTVRIGLDQSIAILTPWFFNNMPRIYYQTTPRPEKVRHLSAIITGHIFETKQTVELWNRDRTKVTYIGPGGDRSILVDMAHRLSTHGLKMGSLYFSRDNLLFLSTFHCSNYMNVDRENRRILEKIEAAEKLIKQEFSEDPNVVNYITNLDNDFVTYATAARIQITYRMVRHMQFHEGAHTFFEPIKDSLAARLTVGMKNVSPEEVIEQVLFMFNRYEFNIGRAFVIKFDKGYDEPITIMHFTISHGNGQAISDESVHLLKLNKALRTLGWVDTDDYEDFTKVPFDLSINAANLIRSCASWVHVMLGKQNPYYYSNYKIGLTFKKHEEITKNLIHAFRVRFDYKMDKERKEGQYKVVREKIDKLIAEIIDEVERDIFCECCNLLDHILITNYFMPTKTGLAFRIDPAVLNEKFYPQKPFGIYFIVGRDYRFFQVRWKDIARGGLRVVMPRTASDYDFALAGLFDEVYGLSHAQQLKNKDIPEGGSKAVLLLKKGGHRHQAVRGAINAMLDILVAKNESEGEDIKMTSYYSGEEIIYLGPDENMTNDLIEWVPVQAQRRGYRYAPAFMSSKPGAGINHKEYGVTSEGVHVFVHNMLNYLGINPYKERFTVKITGGPDGDVAGNELCILHREYGENPRVVAVADGFGAAYDANGLAWDELLRLVKSGLSIAEFSKAKISSKDGFVIKADTTENIRIRNELHSRTKADIFIPAGGRPYTVNNKNWENFLDKDGVPSCRAIVEGANIFFTPEARGRLQEHGVLIIKDSSANKTGVICSSYEIIAGLTLSTEEFLEIKDVYVNQVIEILRKKADAEAKLLFHEFTHHGGKKTLVELSMEISREINEVTDILLDELTARSDDVLNDTSYQSMIYRHVPPVLVEKFKDRILTRLPTAHKIAVLAAYIASYIVYREGLGWLDGIPPEARFEAARTYMEQDELTYQLIESVARSKIKEKEKITSILRMSAARDLTILEMEKRHSHDD